MLCQLKCKHIRYLVYLKKEVFERRFFIVKTKPNEDFTRKRDEKRINYRFIKYDIFRLVYTDLHPQSYFCLEICVLMVLEKELNNTQLTLTCLKSTIETLEKDVKYVQS